MQRRWEGWRPWSPDGSFGQPVNARFSKFPLLHAPAFFPSRSPCARHRRGGEQDDWVPLAWCRRCGAQRGIAGVAGAVAGGDPIVEISRSWEEIEPKRRQTRRTRTAARWRQRTTAPNLVCVIKLPNLCLLKCIRYILGPTKTKILYLEWVTNSADQIC